MSLSKLVVSVRRIAGFLWDRTLLGFSLFRNPEWLEIAWSTSICFLIGLITGAGWFVYGNQPVCLVFAKDEGCLAFNFARTTWSSVLGVISLAGFGATGVCLLATAFAVYAERRSS